MNRNGKAFVLSLPLLLTSTMFIAVLASLLIVPVPQVAATILFQDGFESGNFSAWTNTGGSPVVTSGGAYSGTYKAVLNASAEFAQASVTPIAHGFMRAYVNFKSFPVAGVNASIMGLWNSVGSRYMVDFRLANIGGLLSWTVRYYDGGSYYYVNSSAMTPALHRWDCIEVEAVANTTDSALARVYVNGTLLSDLTVTGKNNDDEITEGYIWTNTNVEFWYDAAAISTTFIGGDIATFSSDFESNDYTAEGWAKSTSGGATADITTTNPNTGTGIRSSQHDWSDSGQTSWLYHSFAPVWTLHLREYVYVDKLPQSGKYVSLMRIDNTVYPVNLFTAQLYTLSTGIPKWQLAYYEHAYGAQYLYADTDAPQALRWYALECSTSLYWDGGVWRCNYTFTIDDVAIWNITDIWTDASYINAVEAGVLGTSDDQVNTLWIDDVAVSNVAIGLETPSIPAIAVGPNRQTNTTARAHVCMFSVDWISTLCNLSTFTFGTNNTGVWVNQTAAFPTNATTGWSNVTETLDNATWGGTIQWQMWANNTYGNASTTGLQTFSTRARLIFATDFENVTTWESAHKLYLGGGTEEGIPNYFEVENGGDVWIEGLENDTLPSGVVPPSGNQCIALHVQSGFATVNHRAEFNLIQMDSWTGSELFVSCYIYMPTPLNLTLANSWYSMGDAYQVMVDPYRPYVAFLVERPYGDQPPPNDWYRFYMGYRDYDFNMHQLGTIEPWTPFTGAWQHLEYYVDRSPGNGRVMYWINGTLLFDVSGIPTDVTWGDSQTTPAKIYYGNQSDNDFYIWLDDLEVWTSIPPGTGGIPPETPALVPDLISWMIMPLLGMSGFGLCGFGLFYVGQKIRDRDVLGSIKGSFLALMFIIIGAGLIIGWLW